MATSTYDVDAYPQDQHSLIGEKYTADGAIKAGDVLTAGAAAGEVSQAAAGENFIGVAEVNSGMYDEDGSDDDYEDGDLVRVYVRGIVKLEANASVTRGDTLVTDAGGTVKPAANDGSDAVGTVVGRALEDGSDGDRVRVVIN